MEGQTISIFLLTLRRVALQLVFDRVLHEMISSCKCTGYQKQWEFRSQARRTMHERNALADGYGVRGRRHVGLGVACGEGEATRRSDGRAPHVASVRSFRRIRPRPFFSRFSAGRRASPAKF